MRKFILHIIILISIIKVQGQNDTNTVLNDAIALQKHSNLYFWFATESENQLKYYLLAEDFAHRSNKVLDEINGDDCTFIEYVDCKLDKQ